MPGKYTLLILLVLVLFAGCDQPSDKQTSENAPYKGEDYQIVFPEAWEIDEDGLMGQREMDNDVYIVTADNAA